MMDMGNEKKTMNELEELEELRKKVEAQDRELSIQNALERARALAMRDTSEIGNVTDALYEEVQALGFDLEWLTIGARDSSGNRMSWSAGEGHRIRDHGPRANDTARHIS